MKSMNRIAVVVASFTVIASSGKADRERAKQVLDAVTCSEGNRDRSEPKPGDHVPQVVRPLRRDVDQPDHQDEDLQRAPQERHEHVVELVRALGRLLGEHVADHIDEPEEGPDTGHGHDQLGSQRERTERPHCQVKNGQGQVEEERPAPQPDRPPEEQDRAVVLLVVLQVREPVGQRTREEAHQAVEQNGQEEQHHESDPLPVLEQERCLREAAGKSRAQPLGKGLDLDGGRGRSGVPASGDHHLEGVHFEGIAGVGRPVP